jgi:hypothetical protein
MTFSRMGSPPLGILQLHSSMATSQRADNHKNGILYHEIKKFQSSMQFRKMSI